MARHITTNISSFIEIGQSQPVAPEGGRHTNLKFGMAAPYQSAEIWANDFQENH